MSGKSRRRVTVESKTLDGSDKRKMSVFERLGPGAPSRKNREEGEKWSKGGFSGKSRSKQRTRDKSPPDLRHKVPRRKARHSSSESDSDEDSDPRRDKEHNASKVKSAVMITKHSQSLGRPSHLNPPNAGASLYSDEEAPDEDVDTKNLLLQRQKLMKELDEIADDDERPNLQALMASSDESDPGLSNPQKSKKRKEGKSNEPTKKKKKKVKKSKTRYDSSDEEIVTKKSKESRKTMTAKPKFKGVDYSDTSNSSSSEDDKPHHRLKQKEYRSSSSIPMKDKKRARHSPSPVIAPPRMRNQGARPQALRPRRDPSSSSSSESSSDYSISPPRKATKKKMKNVSEISPRKSSKNYDVAMKTGRIKGRKLSPGSAGLDRAGRRIPLAQSPREAQQFKKYNTTPTDSDRTSKAMSRPVERSRSSVKSTSRKERASYSSSSHDSSDSHNDRRHTAVRRPASSRSAERRRVLSSSKTQKTSSLKHERLPVHKPTMRSRGLKSAAASLAKARDRMSGAKKPVVQRARTDKEPASSIRKRQSSASPRRRIRQTDIQRGASRSQETGGRDRMSSRQHAMSTSPVKGKVFGQKHAMEGHRQQMPQRSVSRRRSASPASGAERLKRLAGYDTSGADTERMHRGHERTTSSGAGGGGGGGGGHVEEYSRMNSTLDRYGHERKQLVRNNRDGGLVQAVPSERFSRKDQWANENRDGHQRNWQGGGNREQHEGREWDNRGGFPRDQSREQGRDLGRDQSREMGREHGGGRDQHRDQSRDQNRDLNRDQSRELTREQHRDLSREQHRDLSREQHRDLSREQNRNLNRDHNREFSRDQDPRDHSRDVNSNSGRDTNRVVRHRSMDRDVSDNRSRPDGWRNTNRGASQEMSRQQDSGNKPDRKRGCDNGSRSPAPKRRHMSPTGSQRSDTSRSAKSKREGSKDPTRGISKEKISERERSRDRWSEKERPDSRSDKSERSRTKDRGNSKDKCSENNDKEKAMQEKEERKSKDRESRHRESKDRDSREGRFSKEKERDRRSESGSEHQESEVKETVGNTEEGTARAQSIEKTEILESERKQKRKREERSQSKERKSESSLHRSNSKSPDNSQPKRPRHEKETSDDGSQVLPESRPETPKSAISQELKDSIYRADNKSDNFSDFSDQIEKSSEPEEKPASSAVPQNESIPFDDKRQPLRERQNSGSDIHGDSSKSPRFQPGQQGEPPFRSIDQMHRSPIKHMGYMGMPHERGHEMFHPHPRTGPPGDHLHGDGHHEGRHEGHHLGHRPMMGGSMRMPMERHMAPGPMYQQPPQNMPPMQHPHRPPPQEDLLRKVDAEYEEISDDDLDIIIGTDDATETSAEEVAAPTVAEAVDVLDIPWASLTQDTAPKTDAADKTLRRFTPASVFARIGVSKQFAGAALVEQVKARCQAQLNEEAKKDAADSGADKSGEPVVAKKFELLHDVAMLHAVAMKNRQTRATLLSDIGPHRKALCAHRDLQIRRKLCGLVESEIDAHGVGMISTHTADPELYNLSLKLLKREVPSLVGKKVTTASTVPTIA